MLNTSLFEHINMHDAQFINDKNEVSLKDSFLDFYTAVFMIWIQYFSPGWW